MTDFQRDKAYEQRIHQALMDALFAAVLDPEKKVAVFRTGEIVNVMEIMSAMLLASSPVVGTPMKLRSFTDEAAKRMRRRVQMFQEKFAKDGAPWETMVIEGEVH